MSVRLAAAARAASGWSHLLVVCHFAMPRRFSSAPQLSCALSAAQFVGAQPTGSRCCGWRWPFLVGAQAVAAAAGPQSSDNCVCVYLFYVFEINYGLVCACYVALHVLAVR